MHGPANGDLDRVEKCDRAVNIDLAAHAPIRRRGKK